MKYSPIAWVAVLIFGTGCSDILPDPYEYGTVEVEVVRRSGEPISGADITLYSGGRHLGYGTTGEDGRHEFEFVVAGTYALRAGVPDGYAPLEAVLGGSGSRIREGVRVDGGESAAVSFTLLKLGDGEVEVRAADSLGTALEGVRVALYTASGVVEEGVTNDDGVLVFRPVPLGNYGVRARPPAGYVNQAGDEVSYAQGILIEDGVYEVVDFTFDLCRGTVRARALNQAGEPISGIPVVVYTFEGVLAVGETGPDGTATFADLDCGNVGISVRPALDYTFPPEAGGDFVDGIEITQGSDQTFTFTGVRCEGRIRVLVLDAEGAPVPAAIVTLYAFDGVIDREQTDGEGIHEFDPVLCGTGYGVSVQPPDGFTVEAGRGTSFFDGIEVVSDDTREITFRLDAG